MAISCKGQVVMLPSTGGVPSICCSTGGGLGNTGKGDKRNRVFLGVEKNKGAQVWPLHDIAN